MTLPVNPMPSGSASDMMESDVQFSTHISF